MIFSTIASCYYIDSDQMKIMKPLPKQDEQHRTTVAVANKQTLSFKNRCYASRLFICNVYCTTLITLVVIYVIVVKQYKFTLVQYTRMALVFNTAQSIKLTIAYWNAWLTTILNTLQVFIHSDMP